ncbi:hypothetical protein AWV80_06795 [Cupriavidus sp. UYMU48A]|nr:hypothetical protein AWV80_06795 [Cupriavidus sp. UYMU48A]
MRRVGDDGQVLQGFIHSLRGGLALVLQDGLGLERLLSVSTAERVCVNCAPCWPRVETDLGCVG